MAIFFSSQLEERAMEELLQYYGGLDNACEFVTVQRVPTISYFRYIKIQHDSES